MYKKVIVIIGLLFLTSCVNNPPRRGSGNSSYGTRDVEVLQQNTSKWITPKESVCKANGGKIDKHGVCKSNWENAKKICSASGGTLASHEVLGQVVTDCRGILNNDLFRTGENSKKNKKNSNYQSCYKSKGFHYSNHYWSSTNYSSTNGFAWLVSFNYGYQYNHDNHNYNYVRCVRAGQ